METPFCDHNDVDEYCEYCGGLRYSKCDQCGRERDPGENEGLCTCDEVPAPWGEPREDWKDEFYI